MACIVAVTGCNGNIFVDRIEADDEPVLIYVHGDDGHWAGPVSTKGLVRAYVNYKYEDKQYVTYYGTNGTVDADCPASQLRDIVYENPARWYGIGFLGDMVYFTSNCNALDAFDVILNLEYEDGQTRKLHFFVEAGKRLVYGGEFQSVTDYEDDVFQDVAHRYTYSNNGPVAQKFILKPYESLHAVIDVNTEESWATGLKVDMDLPVYTGQWWTMEKFEGVAINQRLVQPMVDYADATITVDVPPYTKATVDYCVNLSRAVSSGQFYFYNEVTEDHFQVDFTVMSYYPTSYVYNVTLEDL